MDFSLRIRQHDGVNHIRTYLIMAIGLLCLWWLLPKESVTPPQSRPAAAKNVIPPARPVHTTTTAPAIATTVASPPVVPVPKDETDPHKAPAGTVPFDLIGGWVVAYGDVLLGKPTTPEFPKNGFIEAPKLHYWDGGVIPFSIHASMPNPERVLRVIAYFNETTPVRFVPYNGQSDSVVFMPFEGLCLSYLGRVSGNQPIYLDDRCNEHEITHEIMHALGFIHEHTRADRDRYVAVNWKNIEEDKQSQFMISPTSLHEPLDKRPFDYNSVMIYSGTAFALDRGQPTLVSRGGEAVEPVVNGLSPEDAERLRLLYGRAR
jgi:Astacin (Peptidase family M12A)